MYSCQMAEDCLRFQPVYSAIFPYKRGSKKKWKKKNISHAIKEADLVIFLQYYEELKRSGVQITKHIFMALINAYAACGQFEKAKKV